MSSAAVHPSVSARSVLFVAREPDETLRTFLPVVDRLRETAVSSRVLFHHRPGDWALDELASRGVDTLTVNLPEPYFGRSSFAAQLGRSRAARTVDEIARFWRARRLAREVLSDQQPSAIVVVQDTLLLERFLVREGNRLGLPTVVVQWAFNYPQAMYDRLRHVQHRAAGRANGRGDSRASPARHLLAPLTRATYRGILSGLGLSFDMVESYGGGEARIFAVMGEAFKEQYLAQGVRGKRIEVTGHPTHDAAYALAQSLDVGERGRLRARYGLPADRPVVLYATQPVLWRRVITAAQLEQNVRTIARAVAECPEQPPLVLKLHPRERADDYAFCAGLEPPVRVIPDANMTELIAASDAFISSSSSTVLLAMMLDRPIVTVNFNDVPHFDFFESIGGTLHTRTPDEFSDAIRRALGDEPTRQDLALQRERVLSRYTRFDGRATERLANLIAEAIVRSREPLLSG